MIEVALFDVAGTLTDGNSWRKMIKHPYIRSVQRLRLMAWAYPAWMATKIDLKSEVDFRDGWIRGMAGLLKGWPRESVQEIFRWVVEEHTLPRLVPETIQAVEAEKAQGHTVIFVSNMFEEAVQMVADQLGADKGIGSRLQYRNNIATGEIEGVSCSGPAKLSMTLDYLRTQGRELDLSQSAAAYSDSWSDRFLLEGVAEPHAVFPDKKLLEYALENNWPVIGQNIATNHLDC